MSDPVIPRRAARARQVELFALYALVAILPTIESLKHFLVLIYLGAFVVGRWHHRQRPRSLGAIAIASLAWLATDFASTVANWPVPNGFKGFYDALRILALFTVVRLADYDRNERLRIGYYIVGGAVIGLAVGLAEFWLGLRPRVQFHSAGVVTQSSIYLGVCIMVAASLLWTRVRGGALTAQPALLAALVFLVFGLFMMASRGGILAVAVCMALFIPAMRNWRLGAFAAAVLLAGLALMALLPNYFGQEESYQKLRSVVEGKDTNADLARFDNWRIAIAELRRGENVWLGVGPRNYAAIDLSKLHFDPPLGEQGRLKLGHAHNLFLTKWVETGAIGLAVFLFFWYCVVRELIRRYRTATDDWRWGAALGACVVPIVAGSFNSPFFLEHAMLAMIVLGLFLQGDRRRD